MKLEIICDKRRIEENIGTYILTLELSREYEAGASLLQVLALAGLLLHDLALVVDHVVDGLEVVLGLIVEDVLLHGHLGVALALLLLDPGRVDLHLGLAVELQDLHGRLLADAREHRHAALSARLRERGVHDHLDLVGIQLLLRRGRPILRSRLILKCILPLILRNVSHKI